MHRRFSSPPRLPRATRATLIAIHSVGSSAWLGVLLVLGISNLAELRSHTVNGVLDGLTGAYLVWVLVPTVALVLATGLILAAYSPWGLVRHWWLIGKLGLTAILTCYGLAVMLAAVHTPHDRLTAAAVLGTATVLSVVKPWGRTPFAPTRWARRESGQPPA